MLGSREKKALSDLVTIISSLNLPMILVGAGARLLVFDRKFGEGRATKDWDIAISIDSWQIYEQLRLSLTTGNYPLFRSTKNSHKFIHIKTNIEVDIVPFGKIGEPNQKIVWSDSGNSMNVSGFAEALSSAKTTTIDNELEIKVVDTPAFVVLKVFAWGDRGDRTNKDLEDIEFILSKYEDDERVYSELIDELTDEIVNFLDASIYLLGQDISKILEDKTLLEFNSLLTKLIESLDNRDSQSLGDKLQVLKQGMLSISTDVF